SERFGEVCLLERLMRTHDLWVAKVNESLGLLEYYDEGEMVLGFTNNGEIVMEIEDDDFVESQIEVYEPSSGRLNSVGISGKYATFSVM
ncbi:hypothetical protein Tco_1492784, partial [Tanacetum coccineum]